MGTPLRLISKKKTSDDNWATPSWLSRILDLHFKFDLDVCALPETAKAERYFTPGDNALIQPWIGTIFMNPPYSEALRWMRKAYGEALVHKETTVVCLMPSHTDVIWWHDYAMRGDIWFLRGRLTFGEAEDTAPFASAIVIFRHDDLINRVLHLPKSISKLDLQRMAGGL